MIELLSLLGILACIGWLMYLGLLPPRTPTWRRARNWFWRLLPIAAGLFYVLLAFIDPAGPGWLYYGTWLLFCVVAGLWFLALGYVKSEWARDREARRAAAAEAEAAAAEPVAVPAPRKPWMK